LARPERGDRRAGGRDDDHHDRKRRQSRGHPARLGVGNLGFPRFIRDHLVDQRAELAIERVHVAAKRLGGGPGRGLRHARDRLLQQPLEAVDPLELEALFRLGVANEGQLVEGQAPQSLDPVGKPAAAREQRLAIDRRPEQGFVAELLKVSVGFERQFQIGLHFIVREQGPLQSLLHLARAPGQQSPHDERGTQETEERDR
jgi:hypothetical protein